MSLKSVHPSFNRYVDDWRMMRHAYDGERAVKEADTEYLKPTAGMVLDGMEAGKPGRVTYDAYKSRAVFPDYVSDAVEMYIGLLHSKEATIELPAVMQPLLERATVEGESLLTLLRRINEQQLTTGRLGLMLDMPPNPDPTAPMPYIALYYAETIRNWDESADNQGVNALNMVVLDESGSVRQNDFEWTNEERYRVLMLMSPALTAQPQEGETTAEDLDVTEQAVPRVYMQGTFSISDGGDFNAAQMVPPTYRGVPLDALPFVVVNSKDIVPSPDNPPLLGLGRRCMAIYRGEADYRQNLYMQGQDTLVVIGGTKDEALRMGAGAKIDVDLGGDAKYIGVTADGLEAQRQALDADIKVAESKAGTLISPTAGKQESGDALTTRLAAQTASLQQIALAGAKGLEQLLRIAARWMGQDENAVKVTPNTDFAPATLNGQEVTQLMAARTMGAPLSLKSIHGTFVNRGLTQMSYEEELDVIAEEDADRAQRVAKLPQPPAPPAPPAKQPPAK